MRMKLRGQNSGIGTGDWEQIRLNPAKSGLKKIAPVSTFPSAPKSVRRRTRGLRLNLSPSVFIHLHACLKRLPKIKITQRPHLSFLDLPVNPPVYRPQAIRTRKNEPILHPAICFSPFPIPSLAVPKQREGGPMFIGCSAFDVGFSTSPGSRGLPRYLPWFPLSNPPEYRIGIPCRCFRSIGLSLSFKSSQELLKKQFDRIGNRMDHLMIVMAAGKTLIVSSDVRGNEVVGCKKLVTRTGVQQPATKPKRQQLYFTHATPLEK